MAEEGRQPLLDQTAAGSNPSDGVEGRGQAPAGGDHLAFSFRHLGRAGTDKTPRDAGRWFDALMWKEARKQLELAVPMVVIMELQSLVSVVSLAYVGHLGALELASAAVATSLCNCTGFIVLIGMASALETLCGQAFGAGHYHLLGVYMQRALIVLLTGCIPMAILWFYVEPLLLLMGQKHDISAMAGRYAIWLIPALPANAIVQVATKFLQTQSIMLPMTLCSLATLLFSIPTNQLLIHTFGLGFVGAALAVTLTFYVNAGLMFAYIVYGGRCKETWTGFTLDAFKDLGPFFELALPSGFMVCLEYWTFEMMVLIGGLLPHAETNLSALSICIQTSLLYFMISFGIGAAASTRVANELGAGQPERARLATYVATFVSSLQGVTIAVVLLSIRNVWGAVFSSEDTVKHVVAVMLPLVATSCILDSIQAVLSGVVRGCGRQDLGARINLGAFYLFGIPAAVIFAFRFGLQAPGLWGGIVTGLFVQTVGLSVITLQTDWKAESEKALALVEQNEILHFSDQARGSRGDLTTTPLLTA